MHYGEYHGALADAQPKRMLILGESHHGDGPEDMRENGECTSKTVKDYLEHGFTEQRLQFFHKIALSFGTDVGKDEEKKLFWDKVFFGNYVDELCGVGDTTAKKRIAANRSRYNQELARFVNEHQIEAIFCFSVLAYWALPVSEGGRRGIFSGGQKVVGENRNRNTYLRGYICQPIPDSFDHPVTIYGIPHPSARGGFHPKDFSEDLRPVFEDCCG